MSIRSSIFASKTPDPESMFMSKGVLPPLISPTLPSIYRPINLSTADMIQIQLPPSTTLGKPQVVTHGENSYSIRTTANGNMKCVVKLKFRKLNLHSRKPSDKINAEDHTTKRKKYEEVIEEDDDVPLQKKARSPVKRSVEPKKVEHVLSPQDQALIEKRKEKSDLFLGKSKHFRNLAAARKRESDELRHNGKILKSILLSLDSVITFFIAFDYEDKSRLVEKKLVTDKSWITLKPYLNSICRIIRDNMTNDKNLKYLLAIASLLRCLCSQHLVDISLALINNSNVKVNRETKQDKILLLKQLVYTKSITLVQYQEEVVQSYRIFEKYLNHLDIKLNFPQTFKKRSLQIEPSQKQESLKPETDVYYIPLSNVSPLQEVALFSKRVIDEYPSTDGATF